MKETIAAALFLFPLIAHADTFESNGLLFEAAAEGECTVIGTSASAEGMQQITIPQSLNAGDSKYTVTAVGPYAFADNSILASVNLPATVVSIGEGAFASCTALTGISLPSGLSEIGSLCFQNCTSLTELTIPAEVVSLPYGMLNGCTSVKSVEIMSNTERIPDFCFADCVALTHINFAIPGRHIGERSLDGCASLKEFDLSNVETLGIRSFAGCVSLKELNLDSSVITIPEGCFEHCSSLTDVSLGKSIVYVGRMAFAGCSSLENLEIGKNVSQIESKAFSGCESLSTIYSVSSLPPLLTSDTFDSHTYRNANLLVLESNLKRYSQSPYWMNFANILPTDSFPSSTGSLAAKTEYNVTRNGNILSINADCVRVTIYSLSGIVIFDDVIKGSREINLGRPERVITVTSSGSKVY